jgi:hypothetical protein
LLFAPFKQVALGVFCVFVSFPFLSYFLTAPMQIESTDRVAITIGMAVLSAIGFLARVVLHRTELSKDIPLHKVLFYRLLFDREIADRKLWNSHAAVKQG